MVRSYWIGPVVVALAVTGFALSQTAPPAVENKERTLMVQEADKPALKCKLLKTWRQPDGRKAFLVQALSTGEFITIAETSDPAPGSKTAPTKIYHWGDNDNPPLGTPVVANNALILGEPIGRAAVAKAQTPAVPVMVTRNDVPPVVAKLPDSKPLPLPTGPSGPSAVKAPDAVVIGTAPKAIESKPTIIASPTLPPLPAPQATVITKAPESTVPPLPSTTVVAKAPSAPPAEDWRQSWGQADPMKAPSATLPTPAPGTAAPAPGSSMKSMQVQTPKALQTTDPLANPDHYSTKLPTDMKTVKQVGGSPEVVKPDASPMKAKPSDPTAPVHAVATDTKPGLPPLQTVANKADDKLPSLPGPMKLVTPPAPALDPKPVPVVSQPATPVKAPISPVRSIAAAAETPLPSGGMMIPDGGNAFSTPVAPPQGGVGAQQVQYQPSYQPQPGAAQMYYPTARPPILYQPMDQGVSPGAANAFTRPTTERPIPANFGPNGQVPNAFDDGNTGSLAYAQPMPNAYAMYPQGTNGMDRGPIPVRATALPYPTQGPSGTPQLMAMLRTDGLPSHREAAAEGLAGRDWRTHPEIVEALVTAAKEDLAPTVRMECLRSLARMNVNTVPVVAVCQALKNDADPRVRQEAAQAAIVLMGNSGTPDNLIRPVSLTIPK